jgi:hypothetical protein
MGSKIVMSEYFIGIYFIKYDIFSDRLFARILTETGANSLFQNNSCMTAILLKSLSIIRLVGNACKRDIFLPISFFNKEPWQ